MAFSFTLPSTSERADLVRHAKTSLPKALFTQPRAEELVNAQAMIMGMAMAVCDFWHRMTFLLTSEGVWLDAHGEERGVHRQGGELDPEYVARIRNPEDAVTRPAILAAINKVLAAAGLGVAYMVELPEDAAFAMRTPAVAADAELMGFASRPQAPNGFGYRAARTPFPPSFIVILPSGTTAATQAAVLAQIRAISAGGVKVQIEVTP